MIRLLSLAFILSACTPISASRPIIDLEGVNMVKHNRDLAACEEWVTQQAFVAGNGVSQCMHDKGYKILRWN
jgi:hypothetical protein